SGMAPFAKIIGTAYPLGDVVLLASLVLLAIQVRGVSLHPGVIWLSVGLAIIVLTDSVYDYQSLHGTYVNGTLLDVGWSLGYMIVALGAYCLRHSVDLESEHETDAAPPQLGQLWTSLLPYALVPLVVALAAVVAYDGHDARLEPGVLIGGAGLTLLVLLP